MSRFIKLNAAGEHLAPDAPEHIAVLDTLTSLTWSANNIGKKEVPHAKAEETAAKVDLLGQSDWRLPTIQELLTLVDYERRAPAIDTAFFPDTKSDWYWSSSPVAGDSEYAWLVYFGRGGSGWVHRDYGEGFVRAVRGSRASQ